MSTTMIAHLKLLFWIHKELKISGACPTYSTTVVSLTARQDAMALCQIFSNCEEPWGFAYLCTWGWLCKA